MRLSSISARGVVIVLAAPSIAIGACTSSPPVSCGSMQWYEISRLAIPEQPVAQLWPGLDLDEDGQIDNAYGDMLSVLMTADGFGDLAPIMSSRLGRDDGMWLVGVSGCDDGSARMSIARGHDSNGNSVPEVPPTTPSFPASVNGIDGGGAIDGINGSGDVPVTILTDPVGTFAPIAWDRAARVATDLHVDATGIDGVIGFALPLPDDAVDIVTPYAAYLTDAIAAGKMPLGVGADTNHDGVVTPAELLADPYLNLFLVSDVMIDSHMRGMSFGVGVHGAPIAVEVLSAEPH